IGSLIRPGFARIENRGIDPGQRKRNFKYENRVHPHWLRFQASRQCGVQKRACRFNRHAMADTELATRPASVDQPAIDLLFGDRLSEQITIDARMARHEWRAKAGRKCSLRLAA